MRSLSPNSVFSRRFIGLAGLAILAGGGCAKFPDGGGVGEFTRVSFRFRVSGAINDAVDTTPLSQYVYIVAVRALDTEDVPNVGAPAPVIGDNSPNGFVAGSPTHFVVYDSTRAARPFILNKFNPGPTAGDPDNPINLGSWFDTSATRRPIINFTSPVNGGDPKELKFDLFVDQLVDSDNLAPNLKKLQVNILAMNVKSTSSARRSWDALGNSLSPTEIVTTLTVDLRFNQIINNASGIEPENDTVGFVDPDVDISDFTIEVQRP